MIDNDLRRSQLLKEMALRDLATQALAKADRFHELQLGLPEGEEVEFHLLIGTESQIDVTLPRSDAVQVLRTIELALRREGTSDMGHADAIARCAPPVKETE